MTNLNHSACNSVSNYKIATLEREKVAWLAGLFQAEAYFHLDKRIRSKSNSPDYLSPPPRPQIKLEMIEEDVMKQVGEYLDKPVIPVLRKTSAGNQVYKITITAREEVEVVLLNLLPYIVGNKTRSKIQELLEICNQYKAWIAAGGKIQAAKLANKASQESKKKKNE